MSHTYSPTLPLFSATVVTSDAHACMMVFPFLLVVILTSTGAGEHHGLGAVKTGMDESTNVAGET